MNSLRDYRPSSRTIGGLVVMADARVTNLPFTPLPRDAGGDRVLRVPCAGPYYGQLLEGIAVSFVQLHERSDGLHDLSFREPERASPLESLFRFAFGQPEQTEEAESAPETPEQIRRAAEHAAANSAQPGDWGRRWYMSVTGLRCRACYSLFEDGEHAYWCPA